MARSWTLIAIGFVVLLATNWPSIAASREVETEFNWEAQPGVFKRVLFSGKKEARAIKGTLSIESSKWGVDSILRTDGSVAGTLRLNQQTVASFVGRVEAGNLFTGTISYDGRAARFSIDAAVGFAELLAP